MGTLVEWSIKYLQFFGLKKDKLTGTSFFFDRGWIVA